MPDQFRMELDTKKFRLAVDRLGKRLKPELTKGLRRGATIVLKELRKDYGGRILRRRTGRLAKSVKIRKGRDRGTQLSYIIRSEDFRARLHETGYTINPFVRAKKANRGTNKIPGVTPLRVNIGGRWVTLKQPTHVPGRRIFARQLKASEPQAWRAVEGFFKSTIQEAGLG